ncbi:MAG: helix-turn-helix transcriptional regulator [Lachnospirales bacterium]
MYKLLLASTQKNTRLLLRTQLKKLNIKFDCIKEVETLEQASLAINTIYPNLIIIDIIDDDTWLDFMQNHEAENRIKFIILCNTAKYSNLQKKLLSSNVFCLVAPFTQIVLLNTLNKIFQQLEYERQLSFTLFKTEQLEETIKRTEMLEDIQAFINGTTSTVSINLGDAFDSKVCYYQVFLIRFYNNSTKNDSINSKLSRFSIKNIIDELDFNNLVVSDSFANLNQLLIFAGSIEEDINSAKIYFLNIAKNIHRTIIKFLPFEVFIGLSDLCKNITGVSLSQAQQALDLRFQSSRNEGEIFFINDYKIASKKLFLNDDFFLFQTLLIDGSINKVRDVIERIIKPNNIAVINIRFVYLELINIVAKSLQKRGYCFSDYIGIEYFNGSIIDRCQTVDEVNDSIYSLVVFVLKSNHRNVNDISFILEKVKRYIEDNYFNEDLSTSVLSSYYNVSLGYLSTMYKKKYGISISSYILNLRLVRSRELLLSTSLTVGRISLLCGFKSASYFMRSFKKKFGSTPSQLRESNSK